MQILRMLIRETNVEIMGILMKEVTSALVTNTGLIKKVKKLFKISYIFLDMERNVISLMNVLQRKTAITMENVSKRIQQQSQGKSKEK